MRLNANIEVTIRTIKNFEIATRVKFIVYKDKPLGLYNSIQV